MSRPQLTEPETQKTGFSDTSGLGQLLRTEREKKGISYSQISEKTMLSPHILEALENEDWRRLPGPFYVRSFIRSYAHLLGINQLEAINLYQEAVPAETTTPEPVERLGKSRKKLYLFCVAILLAVAFALYLWKEDSSRHKTLTNSDKIEVPEKPTQPSPTEAPED
jgi:cytoskeletal protein RodZ